MAIITLEEASRRKCVSCGYDGGDIGDNSCYHCGKRYEPKFLGNKCPECGSTDFDEHCPECDSTEIFYWDDYQEMLKSGNIDKDEVPEYESNKN